MPGFVVNPDVVAVIVSVRRMPGRGDVAAAFRQGDVSPDVSLMFP